MVSNWKVLKIFWSEFLKKGSQSEQILKRIWSKFEWNKYEANCEYHKRGKQIYYCSKFMLIKSQ